VGRVYKTSGRMLLPCRLLATDDSCGSTNLAEYYSCYQVEGNENRSLRAERRKSKESKESSQLHPALADSETEA
jgi:actin-related protein